MLDALSPLDDRYRDRLTSLHPYFSERSLFRHRLRIEVEWLLFLSEVDAVRELRSFSAEEVQFLRALVDDFGDDDVRAIKAIEAETGHDVKAVEYFVKQRLEGTSLADVREFVHFACTSADINNLAYALILQGAVQDAWLKEAETLVAAVAKVAHREKGTAMLAHTHGQPATPTTLGKELAVFVYRWRRQLAAIRRQEYLGKFNGAVGAFNAHAAAYPDVPWQDLSREFVESSGLTYNPLTTQIEPHDYMAELFDNIARFNTVLLDFAQDMWLYISREYFSQPVAAGEVGSSTMPHKVNPIHFENSEANVGISNSILNHLARKLPVSRLQRDLSDSSAQRNIGVGIAHSLLAILEARRGLAGASVNHAAMADDLKANWQVLAEAIQTVMRKAGHEKPYEKLKELTRGASVTEEQLQAFVADLDLPLDDRERLAKMIPAQYTGLAAQLVERGLEES